MTGDELREVFLHFFEEKGHEVVPSSSLVPHGDPTLLLTTAGMVQFKRYFTGLATPPNRRLASCQKCFRATDIDSVGDSKHLTFFEMLGNFSVGDYFKKEAIAWAWEFVTQRLSLAPESLLITIFLDDDEAFAHWRDIGIPAEKILRFGEEDNFWGPAGDTGPCGPCSEIHYDMGEGIGCGRTDCDPGCDCGRFVEIWNLVFTQYDQQEDGQRVPLPKPNIDTGMGLERAAAAIQGKTSVYECDLFAPIIDRVSKLAGKQYGGDAALDRAIRVVAEHGRAATFLIADGVVPSNEGRGYVLRRVIRRAALFGRKLGLEEPFLGDVAQAAISEMGRRYPELVANRDSILSTIESEEARFNQSLVVGLNLLDGIIEEAKDRGEALVPGDDVFRLYDTYGFPKELTDEIAHENGLAIDSEGFEKEMERQRERARGAQKAGVSLNTVSVYSSPAQAKSRFIGYDELIHDSSVEWLGSEGKSQSSVSQGEEVEMVISETPFYGEMGGQVGDTGEIRGQRGRMVVTDTLRTPDDITVHQGKVVEGTISVGEEVEAIVDEERRLDIARNHTATHLLQAALRQALGSQVQQSGSLVTPERFRLDFTHLGSITKEELDQVQRTVNEWVRQNLPVRSKRTSYGEAIAQGALAFFGEKYGEEVTVLEIGEPVISAELCGGTHVKATGEIGLLLILGESGIGSGMRRIEAVTGRGAEDLVESQLSIVEDAARDLRVSTSELNTRVRSLQAELDGERKKTLSLERELSRKTVDSLVNRVESINGVSVLAAKVPASNMESLRHTGDLIKERVGSAVIVLGAVFNNRPNFVVMVAPDLVARGLNAGDIVKRVAAVTGGSGGGRPELGQAGGKDKGKLDDALKLARELVGKT